MCSFRHGAADAGLLLQARRKNVVALPRRVARSGADARAFNTWNARLRQAKACLLAFRGKDFQENLSSFHSL